jgi:hypothetical protein
MFRISQKEQDLVIDVDTIEQIEPVIRAAEPGQFWNDEFPMKPFPSGHTVRRWGIGIKRDDGSVVLEPDPWEA